jgi:hypothetical protein
MIERVQSRASRRVVIAAGFSAAAGLGAGGARSQSQAHLPAPAETCSPIVELRQYTLHPGQRDVLIALFEDQFVESQEVVGARIIGMFRDLDDPDRYVWLRGFEDMVSRASALGDFYGGPAWQAHRAAANATIVDSDNVLLLRPAWTGAGFPTARLHRPARGVTPRDHAVVIASLHYLDPDMVQPFTDFFAAAMRPKLEAIGIRITAAFATETSPNTFPRLPVRERERVFVWFSSFPSADEADRKLAALRRSQTWRDGAPDPILHQLARKPEVLRLAPAARSGLRG